VDVGVDEDKDKRDTVEQLDQHFDAKYPFAKQHIFHAFHRKIAENHGECQGCGEKTEQFCVDQLLGRRGLTTKAGLLPGVLLMSYFYAII
jgi:hypothetical protein